MHRKNGWLITNSCNLQVHKELQNGPLGCESVTYFFEGRCATKKFQ